MMLAGVPATRVRESDDAPPLAAVRTDPALSAEEEAERSRLHARPDFPGIARTAATKLCASYRNDRLLSRLMNDRGRLTLMSLMIDLHFEPPEAQGLTSGRLKAEAAALDICSPGRVSAVLAACRLFGLVASAPDDDRRRRRLVVTDRLLDLHRERWAVMLEALASALPEGAEGLARLRDKTFLAAYVGALVEPIRAGWRPVFDVPSLELFVERDGGLILAFALFENGGAGAPLSAAELARSYKLSRSHIVDILQQAVDAGLVRRIEERAQGGPGFVARPALVDAMEMLLATALVRQARAVRRGLAATAPG
ncbi:hypothetical protein [Ancylobacter mangrovi]|uniref:hypothetical protein n=1 Tax=Ancylobacter mangrovi TaxID=2972472 RepID=UPI0021636CA1|nr:hypothetical protein [Ancylobacter mangrovi]MCS0505276.1 hypothetical protein [Ancylobacter mangrovi]